MEDKSLSLNSIEEILSQFEGHIYKKVNLTNYNEREDLAQEIRLKMIEKIMDDKLNEPPGFFEVLLSDEFI